MSGRGARGIADRAWNGRPARGLALAAVLGLALLAAARPASGGAFIFAGEVNGVDLVTHPTGYTGVGGNVSVSVCVDPASPNAASMEVPLQNIVATFNAMSPIQGNLVIPSSELAGTEYDFESVALHEVGHCIGLAHPNAATESGLSGTDTNYTKAADGVFDTMEFNTPDLDVAPGPDGVKGSADDVRGDDVNLHWFRMSNNDPFTLAATVDSTTYARATASLPGGDAFAANADRSVAALLGAGSTESVMQQGSFFDEEQRRLCHDDVATLRYARSGLDSIAGNADDYTVTLTYAGTTDACDVVVSFDNAETGFAVCKTSGIFLTLDDAVITGADVFFNTGFNWFFNTASAIFTDGFESGDTASWSSTAP